MRAGGRIRTRHPSARDRDGAPAAACHGSPIGKAGPELLSRGPAFPRPFISRRGRARPSHPTCHPSGIVNRMTRAGTAFPEPSRAGSWTRRRHIRLPIRPVRGRASRARYDDPRAMRAGPCRRTAGAAASWRRHGKAGPAVLVTARRRLHAFVARHGKPASGLCGRINRLHGHRPRTICVRSFPFQTGLDQ